ncbi:MAG: MFS transporter [bacterium]|nr:MFS transporter [bacterium]
MQLFHFHVHLSLHRRIKSAFFLLETSIWLHVFAQSLVAVFIPIFFLELDYTIGEVIIYYVLYNFFDVPLNFLARWLTRKFGARAVIVAASVALIVFFSLLYALKPDNWALLVWIALFAAIYDALYWVAHVFYFMKCSTRDENISRDASSNFIISKLAAMLAPALGAFLLIAFNRQVLLIVSAIVLACSVIPLLRIRGVSDRPKKRQLSWREFFGEWRELKDYVSIGLFGVHGSAETVMWPVFIYLVYESVSSVALLPIVVAIATMIFAYFTGRVDKKRRSAFVIIGGISVALIWLSRLFFEHTIFFYASSFIIGFVSVMVLIPLDSSLLEKGEAKDPLSTSMYRNTASMFSKFVFYGILAFLINVIQMSFIVAALAMFILVIINWLIAENRQTRQRNLKVSD